MKKIKLSQNKYTIVDDEDYESVIKHTWYFNPRANKNGGYAYKSVKGKTVYLHRFILDVMGGIDHKNGDGLDNRQQNLREANQSLNSANARTPKNNTTGHKGVYFLKESWRKKKWWAYITVNYKRKSLGTYFSKKDAALAYNKAALKYFGEFARINKV